MSQEAPGGTGDRTPSEQSRRDNHRCSRSQSGGHVTLLYHGGRGFPAWGIPPNGTLDFTLEVLKIDCLPLSTLEILPPDSNSPCRGRRGVEAGLADHARHAAGGPRRSARLGARNHRGSALGDVGSAKDGIAHMFHSTGDPLASRPSAAHATSRVADVDYPGVPLPHLCRAHELLSWGRGLQLPPEAARRADGVAAGHHVG